MRQAPLLPNPPGRTSFLSPSQTPVWDGILLSFLFVGFYYFKYNILTLKNFSKYHLPFIAWALIIFIQSSFPAVELPKVEFLSTDKIIHMGVFGLLAGLSYISFIHFSSEGTFTKNAFLWSAIVCIIYGASDEIHQYFVPNRSSELQDWFADIAGVLIMLLIIKYFLSTRFKLFQREKVYGT